MTAPRAFASVKVRGRFHRSVQLIHDWRNQADLQDYLITPTVRDLTQRIVGGLQAPGGTRAWTITGPYGTGKSAFALFLTRLLANRLNGFPKGAYLRRSLRLDNRIYLPVLLVGERRPLKPSLLKALSDTFVVTNRPFALEIEEVARQDRIDDATVIRYFERAAEDVIHHGYDGLFLVVDEFGKFLEHTATNLHSDDLLVMQGLAEAVARSSIPMALITILHTNFSEYLGDVDEVHRAEWRKVQGRFSDVAFQEPPEQLLRLVKEALVTRFPDHLKRAYEAAITRILASTALDEARQRLPLKELLPGCVPLHPLTALLLWPIFRGKLAQNERSLFAFLTSKEPFAFDQFCRAANWEADQPPFLRLDQLYDYVRSSLGVGAYRGDAGRRWVEVDDALERLSAQAPPLAQAVVKTLGLLWMYGAPVGLRATEEAISLALGDHQAVRYALDYLERTSIIVFRRFERAYALWEGSDVDLEARYAEAKQHLVRGELARRLQQAVELRPLVARAHYIRTGTLRYFTVDIMDGSETALEQRLQQAVHEADGAITFVLTKHQQERHDLLEQARALSSSLGKLHVLAFPRPVAGLEEALEELEGWQWVQENTPALQGDRVARKELEARLRFAQQRLDEIAGRVLGLRGYRFEPSTSDWVHGGQVHVLSTAREFTQWLSQLCDVTYNKAPPLHNELLNRQNLSSAAKAALNRLVKALVSNHSDYRFGFTGTPAEVSMYEAFFTQGGFHHHQGDSWWVGTPNESWLPVWHAVEEFLRATHACRRPVSELYSILKSPPYGVREGPLPLLLCAMLLAKQGDVVLYYNGLFQPQLYDEILELLVRNPESFEIQQIELTAESRATLEAIGDVLHGLKLLNGQDEGSPLLRVVRPLIVAIAKLPPYSKNTRRLNPSQAIALRDAALTATDPRAFLLDDIPRILGAVPDAPAGRKLLAEKLRECLIALQYAYPTLLDHIEGQVRSAFDLSGKTARELQAHLGRRAQPLKGYAADPALSLFINEAARQDSRDWREAIARAVLRGKPPATWSDGDVVEFQLRLRQLASDFMRLEELVAEKEATGAEQIVRIGVLGDTLREVRQVIALHPERLSTVRNMADEIISFMAHYNANTTSPEGLRIKVAALAQALVHFLQEEDEHGS